jgi:hypothetical protein
MTVLISKIWKFFCHEGHASLKSLGAMDRQVSRAVQRHDAEIEIARRFWACPFQALY